MTILHQYEDRVVALVDLFKPYRDRKSYLNIVFTDLQHSEGCVCECVCVCVTQMSGLCHPGILHNEACLVTQFSS